MHNEDRKCIGLVMNKNMEAIVANGIKNAKKVPLHNIKRPQQDGDP